MSHTHELQGPGDGDGMSLFAKLLGDREDEEEEEKGTLPFPS